MLLTVWQPWKNLTLDTICRPKFVGVILVTWVQNFSFGKSLLFNDSCHRVTAKTVETLLQMNSLHLSHSWNIPIMAFQLLLISFCFFFLGFCLDFLFCWQKLPISKILKIVGFTFYVWKMILLRHMSYCHEINYFLLLPTLPYILSQYYF